MDYKSPGLLGNPLIYLLAVSLSCASNERERSRLHCFLFLMKIWPNRVHIYDTRAVLLWCDYNTHTHTRTPKNLLFKNRIS